MRPPHVKNSVSYEGKSYAIKDLCALVHAEGAEVLSTYEKDFYAGYPALTKNKYGDGIAYFIASENEIDFLRAFYRDLAEECQAGCGLRATFSYGVTVSERKAPENGGSLWFVQNFNAREAEIELEAEYQNVETGEKVGGKYTLAAYECLILE